jgi:hypothetical protein
MELSTEDALSILRDERELQLRLTDWTQLSDVPEVTRLAWQPYRQALRDLTKNFTTLEDVVWPTKP